MKSIQALKPISMLITLSVVLILSGCAQRSAPAPVVSVSSGKIKSSVRSSSQYKKEKIAGTSYKVKKGDTLYSIAFRAGIDFNELARLNKIPKPFVIYPNQRIRLKASTKSIATRGTKNKASGESVKKSTEKTSKPLAQQNQRAYVQEKSRQKKEQKTVKKQPEKRLSNKIRNWVWPSSGKVVATFSNREKGNKGIDISGRKGDKVTAAAGGKVVYAGDALRGYGNLIIIKHNDDYLSAYAHNHKILVKEKDYVRVGQQIAEMGDTDSPTVKLHFEVRFRGKSVNPLKYLPKR